MIEDLSVDVAPASRSHAAHWRRQTTWASVMRFYGSCRLHSRRRQDIRELRRGSLRRMFRQVQQETWLFSGSMPRNRVSRDDASEEAIVKADRRAGGSLHTHVAGNYTR